MVKMLKLDAPGSVVVPAVDGGAAKWTYPPMRRSGEDEPTEEREYDWIGRELAAEAERRRSALGRDGSEKLAQEHEGTTLDAADRRQAFNAFNALREFTAHDASMPRVTRQPQRQQLLLPHQPHAWVTTATGQAAAPPAALLPGQGSKAFDDEALAEARRNFDERGSDAHVAAAHELRHREWRRSVIESGPSLPSTHSAQAATLLSKAKDEVLGWMQLRVQHKLGEVTCGMMEDRLNARRSAAPPLKQNMLKQPSNEEARKRLDQELVLCFQTGARHAIRNYTNTVLIEVSKLTSKLRSATGTTWTMEEVLLIAAHHIVNDQVGSERGEHVHELHEQHKGSTDEVSKRKATLRWRGIIDHTTFLVGWDARLGGRRIEAELLIKTTEKAVLEAHARITGKGDFEPWSAAQTGRMQPDRPAPREKPSGDGKGTTLKHVQLRLECYNVGAIHVVDSGTKTGTRASRQDSSFSASFVRCISTSSATASSSGWPSSSAIAFSSARWKAAHSSVTVTAACFFCPALCCAVAYLARTGGTRSV